MNVMNNTKLWVDDLRLPPEGWLWAKTSQEAIDILTTHSVDEVSFDHDLGGEDTTRPIVLWLSELAFNGDDQFPEVCRVHTANRVGREWLVGMIERYGPGVTGRNGGR